MTATGAWQTPAHHAATQPEKAALIVARLGLSMSFGELDTASRRAANLLRANGARRGDRIALMLANEPAWFELAWAALRSGLYITPVNWHLTAAEAAYIVRDSGAVAIAANAEPDLVGDAVRAALPELAIQLTTAGTWSGYRPYYETVAGYPAETVPDESEGSWMFYSSGTTGRPKGILPPHPDIPFGSDSGFTAMLRGLFGFDADTVYLSPAPLYHASPVGWSIGAQRLGGTVVVMDRFDPVRLLEYIERYRVTHLQVVPTHLVRLLRLPAAVRDRYDLSSLRVVVHAAAPCPVQVKRDAIAWLGPILLEFYSGSEGTGFFLIDSAQWLEHQGSVGRPLAGSVHILDEDGVELPPGEHGQVWFAATCAFTYHNDPEKTAAAFDDRGRTTLGDIGWVDDDGYLYLAGRVGNTIISGGVNIYPREAEDILIAHPAVEDVAVVGRPDPDMGEQVVAFVELAATAQPSAELAEELVAFCRERLAHFKCPRSIRFCPSVPRLPNGKLLARLLPVD